MATPDINLTDRLVGQFVRPLQEAQQTDLSGPMMFHVAKAYIEGLCQRATQFLSQLGEDQSPSKTPAPPVEPINSEDFDDGFRDQFPNETPAQPIEPIADEGVDESFDESLDKMSLPQYLRSATYEFAENPSPEAATLLIVDAYEARKQAEDSTEIADTATEALKTAISHFPQAPEVRSYALGYLMHLQQEVQQQTNGRVPTLSTEALRVAEVMVANYSQDNRILAVANNTADIVSHNTSDSHPEILEASSALRAHILTAIKSH